MLNYKTIDFGKVMISKMESLFYMGFNRAILSLCRTLPKSLQTDSMFFMMQYSGLKPGSKLDFFANYYPPVWSILYWLSHDRTLSAKKLMKEDVTHAVTAQSMAMFLHSLDDHLIDGQISVSPLTLTLRSQAWAIMNRAFRNLADGIPAGEKTVQQFTDDYCGSFQEPEEPESLDRYCDVFRRQMAIGMVAPVILSMKRSGQTGFTRDIEIAYGSFGIAWRLLDDIRDICDDIQKGSHSAIYLCLPENVKTHWKPKTRGRPGETEKNTRVIHDHILENGIIDNIRKRICAELDVAESVVRGHNMRGLAREFRCLAQPIRNSIFTQEHSNGKPGTSLDAM